MYFYPYFPHLLSDMSKIKHFPFLRPTPYNDGEPPPPSYSWTLLLSDYHLEGPWAGKGWGQWCYQNNVWKSNKLMDIWLLNAVTDFYCSSIHKACTAPTDVRKNRNLVEKIQNIPS
jgi:hypothetical protein